MLASVLVGLLSLATFTSQSTPHSLNVAKCPGYALSSTSSTSTGLTAKLTLAGTACNAFGNDIADLTIQVTYETETRLHVNIFDTANLQFRVPQSIVALPPASTTENSDLVFNYDAKPFAFWITRRSQPSAAPLFDTRISSLPKTPIPPVIAKDNSTALNGFPLVFEDQYLQITSALPLGTNIYGLGEVQASFGFRRDVGTDGGIGTIQTLWARDYYNSIDQNVYGSHPIYLEHRYNAATKTSQSHGVFLFSPSGADILLLSPKNTNMSLIEYRLIGGVLDFYFFSGPDPQSVIQQYGALIGFPAWLPAWSFGFHLCRWNYPTLNDTALQVTNMRAANIPLEVMWNDIDLYEDHRDFTTDPTRYPIAEVKAFIEELTSNNQHYVPIVDPGIEVLPARDVYDPYHQGTKENVFITNPDGSQYIGQAWPGDTVWPDWFASNTQQWWTDALRNWTQTGVAFSGLWLDMNEVSSFCDNSCGSPSVTRRGLGAANESGVNINTPPYAIHNAFGPLNDKTIAPNATHSGGYAELDVHSLFGLMEERATYQTLQSLFPGKRPFIIGRSTWPSSGKYAGHWTGDNYSKWEYIYLSIQGILQFQIFQIPMVGADTCGFTGNTTEELCNRWMQLSAFTPFYRNHNQELAIPQEPYRWPSVAAASITAIGIRYSLLPYWFTLFANASTNGAPPIRALFFEFPNEPELFSVDRQFLVGRNLLVTPVLTEGATTVDGIFPGQGSVIWRDWYTHDVVNAAVGKNTTLSAPLGHINLHIRDGAALLLYDKPAYTTEETRQGPFALLVALAADGSAFGTAYVDDGISDPPGPSTTVTINAATGTLSILPKGSFNIAQKLVQVTVLGVKQPTTVTLQGTKVTTWQFLAPQQKLVVSNVTSNLNSPITLNWH